jgi:hypothetical protein
MGSAARRCGAYGVEISAGLRQAAVEGGRVEEGGRWLGFFGGQHAPALPSPLNRARGSAKGAALASKSSRWPQGENFPLSFLCLGP